MKIGIVVHGPNIIDSGHALKIINFLENFGEVSCILGGTMGRTAVIDAYLENKIDISTKRLPSESLSSFVNKGMDVIFLLNYGKSSITGHTFGYKVINNALSNLNKNNQDNKNISIIQIERPGEDDGSIISWNGKELDLSKKLSKFLNLSILNSKSIKNKYIERESNGLKLEYNKDKKITDKNLSESKDSKVRYIHGVSPNENIFVNGVVIGKSNSEFLSLISKNGKIVDIIGGIIKPHGLEKLGNIDIDKVVVKTGLLRRSKPKPRIINNGSEKNLEEHNVNEDKKNINLNNNLKNNTLKIAFIDHAAEDIYNLKDCDLAITVGDDTTLIASDILYRFNIPIIGITDGDLDKVLESGYITENSSIIELKSGFDDIVGKSIFKEIFKSKDCINLDIAIDMDLNNHNDNNKVLQMNIEYLNKLKNEKIEDFKNEVLKIVNNITSQYIIKE
ncbi:hypothetical protein ALNOE001_07660 [Candidatus Methanobinarius endosymbioticus]|uniref:DUF2117 domain-containing protein n=1 Tax=Candidatus Methanobinarius endosymbioticus TaxID=2006182 RepID=A0A366MBU0_9EURY|nr:hypothetical protein ALNOE001_07660 [Candidatus Methanobinarius endosymbioticus]